MTSCKYVYMVQNGGRFMSMNINFDFSHLNISAEFQVRVIQIDYCQAQPHLKL